MATKKQTVGVLFLVKIPTGEFVALLQVRGPWNEEKDSPESFPGGCQVTAFGGVEPEDKNILEALFREIKEELGNDIVPIIRALSEAGQLIELVNLDIPEKQVVTYGAIVGENVWKALLRKPKSPTFGGFKVVHRHEIDKIVDLKTFKRETGVTDSGVIAMFLDGEKAVRLAFEKLG